MLGPATLSQLPEIRFWKVESIGNDFVLVRIDDVATDDLPALSRAVCVRRFSVGADGLLAVGLEDGDLRLRMFNPDGTEDFCGNGLRAAGLWAVRARWTPANFVIRHLHAQVPCSVSGGLVETVLPGASFAPEDVPTTLDHELFGQEISWAPSVHHVTSALSTGSTHTVLLCPGPPPHDEIETLGPLIETHPWFPERTSVVWSWTMGPGRIGIRIWERGAGETQGCGTGSSAATVAWFRAHATAGRMDVHNPGGVARVEMSAWNGPIRLSSDAHVVYEGAFSRSLISRS